MINLKKITRKLASVGLSVLMAVGLMSGTGMTALADDGGGISLTYGNYALSKISNPSSGSGQPDGINTNDMTGFPANRLNSYAWAVASRGDSIYIGTNRTLFGSALNAVVEQMKTMNPGVSEKVIGDIVSLITAGDVPVNLDEADYIPQIIRFDVQTGTSEVIYQPGTTVGPDGRLYYTDKDGSIVPNADVSSETASFRSVVEYNGNLYFGSLGVNMLQLVRIDEQDNAEVVFQTLGTYSSLRACCKHDDGTGEKVFFGGQDATYDVWAQYRREHPDETAPLPIVIRYLDPETAGSSEEDWSSLVADFNDFGEYSYAIVYSSGGGNVWDLCSFDGNLYLILAYEGGWALFRGEKGGSAPNRFGWTWTEIVGNNGRYPLAMNAEIAQLNEQYGAEYGCGEFAPNLNGAGLLESTATPYVYNGKMYIGSFDNATMIQSQTVIKALVKFKYMTDASKTGNFGPSLKQIFAPVYEALAHQQHVWVMDENENIEPVESANELLAGTTNDYVWRFIEKDGKLYTGTLDTSTAYNYFLAYTPKRLISLLENNKSDLPEYLQQLMDGVFSKFLRAAIYSSVLFDDESTGSETEAGPDMAIEADVGIEAENTVMTDEAGEAISSTDVMIIEEDEQDESLKEESGNADAELLRQEIGTAALNAASDAEAFLRGEVSVEQLLESMTELESANADIQEYEDSAEAVLSADDTDSGAGLLLSDDANNMIDWLLELLDPAGLKYWVMARELLRNAECGCDIYVTEDGEDWERILADGINDPYNYGARTFTILNDELYVGTANPYYGAQLWKLTDNPPEPVVVIKEPAAVGNLTYNKKYQKLVTPGKVKGGTIYYLRSNKNSEEQPASGWTTTVPTAKSAGTYKVFWKVIGNSDYEEKAGTPISVTIKKKNASISVKTTSKSYKASALKNAAKTFSIGASVDSKGTLSYSAQSYKNDASKKYLKVSTKTGKVTVKKGTPKGSYWVKVKIRSKATANYRSANATRKIKVTVS